jgi:beta-glucosidase-like glycosyl hydrolase
MCSYNAVNGVPACANNRLMNEILRGRWRFDGFVVCIQ